MEIGAADVDVVLAAREEQQRGREIDDDADPRDDHHRRPLDHRRIADAAHGFPGDRADCDQQQQRVGKRRQDRGGAQAIGEALRRRSLGQCCACPSDQQAEDIRQIVARVREQRHRVVKDARRALDDDEGDVERDPDRKGTPEILGGVCMAVAAMRVVVGMMVRAHLTGIAGRTGCCIVAISPRPSPRRPDPCG